MELLSKYFTNRKVSDSETICVPKTKVEKATFSVDFQMDDENGEVSVSFPKKRFGEVQHLSHLEFTITPDEVPEGIATIINKYNSTIQNQIEE